MQKKQTALFTNGFTGFLKDLAKNNNTEWFNENRKRYEKDVKAPFAAFTAEMIAGISKLDPLIQIKPSDAIMRINRDIRFSKDKTPYNTYVAAIISRNGKKDKSYPGFYFQLAPDGIQIFGGVYMPDNQQLQSIRNHIASNLKVFAGLYNHKDFKSTFGSLQGEQGKRLSPEWQQISAKEPLIANKQFYFQTSLKASAITSPDLTQQLMSLVKAGMKMNLFLGESWEGEK